MDTTIREVSPDELCDGVKPGKVTLVLGAPSVGKSHHLRTLGPSVERLAEMTAVDDDELVVVDDFVSVLVDRDHEDWATDGEPSGMSTLFARPGGGVLVTRPWSLDWLYQRGHPVSSDLLARVDSVFVVRTPPTDYGESFHEIRETIYARNTAGPGYEENSSLIERVTVPSYDFKSERLQEQIGTVDESVTPAAFLSLSKHGSETVLFEPDVRAVVEESDASVEPLGEAARDLASDLCPRDGGVGRQRRVDSPAVRTAILLVASSVGEEDTAWLEPFVRHRPLAGAAQALEIAFDLPPGTIEQLRVFASESMRAKIGERLDAQSEPELALAQARESFADVKSAMQTVAPSLDDVSMGPDKYGSSPLVGAWHWDGPKELDATATEREFADAADKRAGPDVDEIVDALDDGVVVLSGPAASGKRGLAARVATELTTWGATVKLPDLRQPDHIRAGIDATPNAVVVAAYGAEPARIMSDAGVRALVDWVADRVCSGAVLICDDEHREQLDAIADRAGCADVAAWRDRTEFSLGDADVAPDRTPRAVAEDLLDAMGWPDVRSPTRRTLDVDPITDQSTLAAIAGIPDADLDAAFVGQLVGEAIDIVAQTARPSATRQWLTLVEDLVAGVAQNRGTADEAIRYRGSVSGIAMATVASERPTADEWVETLAVRALTLTNETATPHGRESVGGDVEPFVTAFATALARLARSAGGADLNQGALATVGQLLHEVVDSETIAGKTGLTLLCRIYGITVGRLVESTDNSAAEEVLAPMCNLVEQAAATHGDELVAFVLGNSFASMFGAVAGAACPPENLSTWVDALGSRVRGSLGSVGSLANQEELVEYAYAGAIGFCWFEFECPADRTESWLAALGADICRTATATDLDDTAAFIVAVYGHGIRNAVGYRDFDRADLLFEACDRLVETIVASGIGDEEWAYRAALHAGALAAFAGIEYKDPVGVKDGPYNNALPFPGSNGFDDWIVLYDGSVRQAAVADGPHRGRAQYLTAVYSGALSTHVRGFDDESVAGISPRRGRVWFETLTDCIETVAGTAELVDDPVAFLRGVYGDAAANWAANGEAALAGEWLPSLGSSLRKCRWEIDGPSKVEWFDAFAEADAAILLAVLTRTDVGERTHDRLVQVVLTQIEDAATAADNPPHPVNYVASVYGTALALAIESDPAKVQLGVTEVVAAVEDLSFEWVGIERAEVFERIYAEALALGHDHPNTEEWLDILTERMETTATRECPEDPTTFVGDVYTRAYVEGVTDGVDAWRRRLDSELRAFVAGSNVDDPAAFLEGVYADIVVAGTTQGQPSAEVEACVEAVRQSVQTASEAGVLGTDDAVVRTFSRAVDMLPTGNPRAQADHTYLLGQALRTAGGEDLESAVFKANGESDPDSSTDGRADR
ncbi:hypothetical protein C482_02756 [Natrialba chahannaoensis JCM 10990]|uniref:Uncharacterized protein n=1 Tax=Natrialba chahannaoensis JCM 10990 TaxID=1227492 RepID=M0B5Z4_9EURY|nr:hypothetical protein [Natrialba chahannaoensis]ELZ05039.1 hypothetical protein C482_02756 [Natrialba chahannaoensis JCM 10990]